jgi:hypothetical protein
MEAASTDDSRNDLDAPVGDAAERVQVLLIRVGERVLVLLRGPELGVAHAPHHALQVGAGCSQRDRWRALLRVRPPLQVRGRADLRHAPAGAFDDARARCSNSYVPGGPGVIHNAGASVHSRTTP